MKFDLFCFSVYVSSVFGLPRGALYLLRAHMVKNCVLQALSLRVD